MMVSSLLYFKKFLKDIESIRFEIKSYNICVDSRIVNGKKHTTTSHVDDVKSIHEDSNINNELCHLLKNECENDNIREIKVKQGAIHDYLGTLIILHPEFSRCICLIMLSLRLRNFSRNLETRVPHPALRKYLGLTRFQSDWTKKLEKHPTDFF